MSGKTGPRTYFVKRRDLQAYCDGLFKMATDGRIEGMSYSAIGETMNFTMFTSLNLKQALVRLGILKTEVEMRGSNGKWAVWTLLTSQEEATQRINAEATPEGNVYAYTTTPTGPRKFKKPRPTAPTTQTKEEIRTEQDERIATLTRLENTHRAKEAAVAFAASEREETRAIAGPDSESPFAGLAALRKDEPGALIAAARQYQERAKAVADALSQLRKLGVVVDEGAVHFERNEWLEVISDLLPHIDRLEAESKRWQNAYQDLKARTADYDTVKRERDALKRSRDERLAERVTYGTHV